MAVLLDEHKSYQDSAGLPLSGGKLTFGTVNLDPATNLITVYSDRELTVALTNPVILDSSGMSGTKVWIPGKFSLLVSTAADVQVYQDLDNGGGEDVVYTTVALLLASTEPARGIDEITEVNGPFGIFSYKQSSGTGNLGQPNGAGVEFDAVPLMVGAQGGLFLAEAFGEIGAGSDDHAVIQLALDAAGIFASPPTNDDIFPGGTHNIGQGTVVLHAGGQHIITDSLSIPPGVTLDLNGSTVLQTTASSDAIIISFSGMTDGGFGLYAASVVNGFIVGLGKDTSTARGIFCEVLNRSQIRNVNIAGFKFGVTLHECQYNTFDTIRVNSCEVGWYITARPAAQNLTCIDNNYLNMSVSFCDYGIWLQASSHSLFERIDSSRNTIVDILFGSQLVGYLTEYVVTAGGSGYSVSGTETVTISGGGGTMAQAFAITDGSGVVTSIVGVDAGDGYTSAPTITVGGSGSGATATVTINDDTGLGDWDGAPAEVRGHNVFMASKFEHDTDTMPSSGYAIIVNDTVCRRNIFEHPALTRQLAGSGPTAYMRLFRSGGFGSVVNYPQDTQNSSFGSILNPANISDFSVFRVIASQGVAIRWSSFQDGDDAIKFAVDVAGNVKEAGEVAQIGYNAAGYTQAIGYVAKNSFTGTACLRTQTFNEANPRFTLTTDGKMLWGGGGSVGDVTMSRPSGNILALGSGDGFGVGNSATNTNTPSGATAHQIPIYDETGSLLGHIPVYGSVW